MAEPIPDDQLEQGKNALAVAADEILSNAFELKGADFTNYAAASVELAQLVDTVNRLVDDSKRKGREKELHATALHLIHSIDSKVSPELSTKDRLEAGALAAQIFARADKLRKEAAGE